MFFVRKPQTAFGRNLRSLRQQRGWTQADLARFSGLTRATITKFETGTRNRRYVPDELKLHSGGRTRGPSMQSVTALAEALGCSVQELICDAMLAEISRVPAIADEAPSVEWVRGRGGILRGKPR